MKDYSTLKSEARRKRELIDRLIAIYSVIVDCTFQIAHETMFDDLASESVEALEQRLRVIEGCL